MKLKENNYCILKYMTEDLVYSKDLYEPIKGDKPKRGDNTDDNDWDIMNIKYVAYNRRCIDPSVFQNITKEIKAVVLMQKLETFYENQSVQNKALLVKKLMSLKYKESHNINEHINDFEDCVNQLLSMDVTLVDELQALLLLIYKLDSWETLVVSISNLVIGKKLRADLV